MIHPQGDTAFAVYRGRVFAHARTVKGTKDGRDVIETTGDMIIMLPVSQFTAGGPCFKDSIFQARAEVPALQISDTTI